MKLNTALLIFGCEIMVHKNITSFNVLHKNMSCEVLSNNEVHQHG